jgi:hypothetical protein
MTESGWTQFVVLDGKQGRVCDAVLHGTPIFSPDSKHVAFAAYSAWKGIKWSAVLDDVCQTEWDDVIFDSVRFQTNGMLSYLVAKQGRLYRVKQMP